MGLNNRRKPVKGNSFLVLDIKYDDHELDRNSLIGGEKIGQEII